MVAFKAYLELIKPGRTFANGMTALAGFLFASKGHIDSALLLAAVGGTSLIVASACAFNNYFDRGIDSDMQRTLARVLVKNKIPAWSAVLYASLIGVAGFALLGIYTNWPTVLAGIIGVVDYLVIYGWSKRNSHYSTLMGSICGAMPIVAGYTAVTGRFDVGALLLFLIMASWQMPHFYAIAIYRRDDYSKARLPIWSVQKGIKSTVWQIILFSLVFLLSVIALTLFGYASKTFLIVVGLAAVRWIYKSLQGLRAADTDAWARSIFSYSLLVLLGLSATMAFNSWLV